MNSEQVVMRPASRQVEQDFEEVFKPPFFLFPDFSRQPEMKNFYHSVNGQEEKCAFYQNNRIRCEGSDVAVWLFKE